MRNYKQKEKNDFGILQCILNQCIICSIILFAILILNLMPSMENMRQHLKMQLSENISVSKIKSVYEQISDFLVEKTFDSKNYYVDEKLLEQISQENEKFNQVKKNSPATL